MMETARLRMIGLSAVAFLAAGCASTEVTIGKPGISLRNVEVTAVDLDSQTFVLDFGVFNPNPFPLPVQSVSYSVELEGLRLAGGETQSAFTVPADGESHFAIIVDADLMRTAPQMLFIVRDGIHGDISYALEGNLAIDMPFVKPVAFRSRGSIRLDAGALAADLVD